MKPEELVELAREALADDAEFKTSRDTLIREPLLAAEVLRLADEVEKMRAVVEAPRREGAAIVIYQHGYCDECGGHDCEDVTCHLTRMTCKHVAPGHDNVHQHEDASWWFGEVAHDCYTENVPPPGERGPFESEAAARASAEQYLAAMGHVP